MTDGPLLPTSKKPHTKHSRFISLNWSLSFWLAILCVVIAIGVIKRLGTLEQMEVRNQGIPVVAAKSHIKDVPVYLTALGNVTATYTVTVKTQINGQLISVLYKEGQMVKAGDLLAEIDCRPYQAQLTQYQGMLERDSSLLANAKIDLARYQKLWKQNSVAQQTLATQESLVQQYDGTVKTDQGNIEATLVNISYCRIVSPVDGRIGLRLVDPGNFVQTSDTTGLAVITTINPITVVFTIPEDDLQQVLPQIDATHPLVVEAYDRQQNTLLSTGFLLTMDNQIDTTTGTVKLKAQFANTDYHLFPNQFVNIKLLVNRLRNAIVVSTAAIQHSTSGDFVYLINNNIVSVKPVVTSVVDGGETVITKGLDANASVVVEGTDKLVDGAKVTVPTDKPTTALQMVSNAIRRTFA